MVDGLSLSVQPGEILVLTGPSGCGKSTVLRALAGLLRPDSGRVLADGHEVTATSRDRGMVFQDSALIALAHSAVQHRTGVAVAR